MHILTERGSIWDRALLGSLIPIWTRKCIVPAYSAYLTNIPIWGEWSYRFSISLWDRDSDKRFQWNCFWPTANFDRGSARWCDILYIAVMTIAPHGNEQTNSQMEQGSLTQFACLVLLCRDFVYAFVRNSKFQPVNSVCSCLVSVSEHAMNENCHGNMKCFRAAF